MRNVKFVNVPLANYRHAAEVATLVATRRDKKLGWQNGAVYSTNGLPSFYGYDTGKTIVVRGKKEDGSGY